jgi:hypothetical protein
MSNRHSRITSHWRWLIAAGAGGPPSTMPARSVRASMATLAQFLLRRRWKNYVLAPTT